MRVKGVAACLLSMTMLFIMIGCSQINPSNSTVETAASPRKKSALLTPAMALLFGKRKAAIFFIRNPNSAGRRIADMFPLLMQAEHGSMR